LLGIQLLAEEDTQRFFQNNAHVLGQCLLGGLSLRCRCGYGGVT
jgi:hypothetical protein